MRGRRSASRAWLWPTIRTRGGASWSSRRSVGVQLPIRRSASIAVRAGTPEAAAAAVILTLTLALALALTLTSGGG